MSSTVKRSIRGRVNNGLEKSNEQEEKLCGGEEESAESKVSFDDCRYTDEEDERNSDTNHINENSDTETSVGINPQPSTKKKGTVLENRAAFVKGGNDSKVSPVGLSIN